MYALTFLPVHFGFLIIRYFTNRIVLTDDSIITRMNFDKFQIDLDKIKSFEVKKKSRWVQLLFGLPAEVIQVEYNKYDTILLFSVDPILLEALSSKKNQEV